MMTEILPATVNDLKQIYEIELEAFSLPEVEENNEGDFVFCLPNDENTGDAFSKRSIRYQIQSPNFYFFVIKEIEPNKDTVIGYITIHIKKNSKTLRLYNFAVRKECRGYGYAEKLYNTVMFPLEEYYYNKIDLEVKVTNTPAIKFYERHGFKIDHEIPYYYHDGQSAYKMSKILSN